MYKKSETITDFIQELDKWLRDFRKTQPKNVEIDYDTLEGSAYGLLGSAKNLLKEWREELENIDQ
jgi:hypothetical protein